MRQTIRSFSAGEIQPSLRQRVDLERYASSLALCKNFIVRAQGGADNRPGTKFIGEVKDSSVKTRLIPFEFNTEQTYALEFGDQIMRVIKDGGYVLNPAGTAIYELATPYLEADLFELSFTQSADTMTICHRDYAPRDLGRTDHNVWTLTTIDFSSQVDVPTNLVLTAVGTGAGSYNKTYAYVVTAIDENGIESLASTEASITTPSLALTAGVQITWDAVTDAVSYIIYKDIYDGTDFYGFIGETKNATFTDYNIAPDLSITPPNEYTPFDTAGNYPGTVGYYQQRKIFANTDNLPQTMFATQIGIFNSMRSSTPAKDDDALEFTINSRQVNEIRHIIAVEDLILLTSGTPFRVTEGQDFVLTPSTIGAKPQGNYGSSNVRPVAIDDSILFVQDKGTRIRDLMYDVNSGRYRGSDLSIMAEHLVKDKQITDMAYAKEPYGILWCITDDGDLLGLTYQKEHKVWAWHQHDLSGGEVESITVISEGELDAVYFIVKRTIDGSVVRYVERMSKRYDDAAENAFFVDCGLSYSGSATTSISGLDHLEGEEVVALADGNVVRGLTVSSGAITLPREASVVHVGLNYYSDIQTLGIDSYEQTTKDRVKNVARVAINILNSRGGWVGPDEDNLIEIKPRFDSDGYDTIALKTFEQEVNIQLDWNDDGQVFIRQIDPLPLAILNVTPEFDIG